MKPYWVTFTDVAGRSGLGLGAGVTGHDQDDALSLIEQAFGRLTVSKITAVDDLASLDQGHVRPNMGSIFLRGVWFPLGHERAGTPQVR